MNILKNSNYQNFLFLLFYFLLFQQITCQEEPTPIKLGETIKGKISLDEGHTYYSLKIPENFSNKILIISTREDNEEYKKSDEKFSDPDFYISKINKFPSSSQTSEWYSEQYGSDIISIPNKSVQSGDIFYIGMYCQFKCRYFLKTNAEIEAQVTLGKPVFLKIKPHETMNYKIKINQDFEELKTIVYSKTSGKFKIFMEKEAPSASKTFKVIPSWNSGYVIIVKKNTEEYCNNCEYHVLIQNESEQETNYIMFLAKIQQKIFDLKKNVRFFDALNSNSQRFFSFNMTAVEKNTEKLIIQITVYSGYVGLLLEGWKSKNINNILQAQKSESYYDVYLEKYILLDKNNFDIFDNENNEFSNKDSILHFCIYSRKVTSYTLKVYYLTSLNNNKGNHYLMQGNKVRGYLLKDQIMIYELTGYNLDKVKYGIETNITITNMQIMGNSNLYGYFCKDRKCEFYNNNLDTLISQQKILISKKETETTSILKINNNENECLKNPNIKLSNSNYVTCQTYILVKCEIPNSDNNLCIFDIQSTLQDTPILMKEKEIYSSSLFLKKDDYYEIIINDPDINSLVVVLNSERGDAELLLYLSRNPTGDYESKKLISISFNKDYIPDVIRVTPQKINQKNLIGKYIARVYAKTASIYKIYYYVTYNKNENEKESFDMVTMNLKFGDVIMDYFPNDIRYKIYSLSPLINQKDNIKIFVNGINANFKIYLFNDISKFKIKQLYDMGINNSQEEISGYQWVSKQSSEIIIQKDDINLNLNKILYIIITLKKNQNQNNSNNAIINNKSVSKFYLGAVASNQALEINEAIPYSMTLTNNYNNQLYHHSHNELQKGLDITLNVFLGEVDIFIDLKYIDDNIINNLNFNSAIYNEQTNIYSLNTMKFKLNIKSHTIINIDNNYIFNYANKNNLTNVHIYYYIRRSKNSILFNKLCQYLLVLKTSENQAQILQPGIIQTSRLKEGQKNYYIIEEIKKRNGAVISALFKKGSGNLFVRIPEIPETKNNIRFPNNGLYDYIGEFIYSGKTVNIPKEKFEKLNNENIKIQILVTLEAEKGEGENNEVEYTISYSNEPKKINQNIPYDGFISKGESQFFTLYFDENVENIYIGVSKMSGDVDIYLNKGLILPTISKWNWCSAMKGHEYIDISIDDEFFKNNKNEKLNGYYTLLLMGFLDSTYSLFVSSHKEKVFTLRNNKPMSCICEKANDKCLYRYNDVFVYDYNNKINENKIIFSTQYLYGSGLMFAKIVQDSELNNEKFYEIFPNKEKYDISNIESNQINYIKVNVPKEKYNKDTIILLTYICNEKTKVDISSISQRHSDVVEYIRDNYENTFYLGEKNNSIYPKLIMIFNNYDKNKDLIYNIHSYVGSAHVKVYANSTQWNINLQKTIYKYRLFKEFDIIEKNDDEDYSIEVYNPFTNEYHNYISKNDKRNFEDIYFTIEPKSEFGFYILCNYDKNYNYLPIGKNTNFYVLNNELYGYFDIVEEYNDIEISLSVEKNLKYSAKIFIKMNIIDTTKKQKLKNNENITNEFNLYHYSIPSEEDYDHFSDTDETLGKLTININKLPKIDEKEKKYKFIRGLFYVRLKMKENYLHEYNMRNPNKQEKLLITLLLTPGVSNLKYVDAKPFEYYFSNLIVKNIHNEPETKIYSLTRENFEHDLMVIEISKCNNGGYEIQITDELVTKDFKNIKNIKYEENRDNGKHTIYIYNPKSKHYFLLIKAKMNDYLCKLMYKSKKNNCTNNLSYLFYYYTTYLENSILTNSEKLIQHRPYGKGKSLIYLPEIIMKDIKDKKKLITDFKFDVIATNNIEKYEKLGNLCFLAKVSNYPDIDKDVFKIDNMKIENENSLIISNLGYRSRYYMNILAQNTKTKELIIFQPWEIRTGGYTPFPFLRIIGIYIIICILVGVLVLYIIKYLRTKRELIYLKGDADNKTEIEMRKITRGSYQRIKYSELEDSY